MTSLKLSPEDFQSWKNSTQDALRALESVGSAPSGEYGNLSGIISGENSNWSIGVETVHQEVSALKEAITTVENNIKEADQAGSK
ncbi:hypothetical protein [Rothia nasimurium]|uniref:hypothetical protein n=1 Tax=Rothia nasimurium TaxID=85336 RepID=UPI001F3E5753|nr:hypothetical protein [Rothia nasimurium]